MTAILMNASPPASAPGNRLPSLPRRIGLPANDDALRAIGAINGPEVALTVRFVGIDHRQQQIALASFPSAKRCTLA